MNGASRIDQFDGLRALAFLAVFLHHAVKAPLLWMGVDLFFVLSGFLITTNLLRLRGQATRRSALAVFYFRRLIRIVPAYYAALTVVLLVRPIGSEHVPWFYAFASNVHDAIYGPFKGSLSSFWSIAVEEQFYLLWPWLVLFLPRRWLPGLFVAFIAIATLSRLLLGHLAGFEAVYRLTICRMDLLAAGGLLALAEQHDSTWAERYRTRFATAAILALGAFAFFSIAFTTFRTSQNDPVFNVVGFGLSTVFFTAVLAYVRGAQGPVLGLLRTPILTYVGQISYMAYLVHELALYGVARLKLPSYVTAALGLGLTIALASTSWYAIERPIMRLRGRVKTHPIERGASSTGS